MQSLRQDLLCYNSILLIKTLSAIEIIINLQFLIYKPLKRSVRIGLYRRPAILRGKQFYK